RLAVAGLVILAVMFAFSFLGGALIPYEQDQVFYREEVQRKEFAGITENDTYRFLIAPEQAFGGVLQAQFTLALSGGKDSFTYQDTTYTITREGTDLYRVSANESLLAVAHKDIVESENADFDFRFEALKAYANGESAFRSYTLGEDGTILSSGEEVGFISRFVVSPKLAGTQISRDFRETATRAINDGVSEFTVGERTFTLSYDAAGRLWSVREQTLTRVWDSYAAPSAKHPLGTDKNGMDMLTRLMYGGRVSLVIGFIVVFISAVLGVILGGVAGYFGGWIDNLIMRIVDIFYCIPSTPLLIILGAAMDGMRVDPQIRMVFLMLILGFLGWPSVSRLVRGQILSLREQEFMTATEACGLSIHRRIFRHLIPNVIPQLIVTCTMSLGSTIITEATLSFLGLGVKFPFASWGNIMNDVSNAHVLTSYWFVWIPAGVCLVLAVLGFNFVGDGLRDAFDPKMKR
ncbi:MAG: ABC transporter permease, partial [Clostridia bacterium]|nr:ABC transporter permease [Clostridia bacterium]